MRKERPSVFRTPQGKRKYIYHKRRPLADVVWCHTGAPSDVDDFVGYTEDGYILRVEQMDRGAWWWQVYGPKGHELNLDQIAMTTKAGAFAIAEICYRSFVRGIQSAEP